MTTLADDARPPEPPPEPYRADRAPWGLIDIGFVFGTVAVALVAMFGVLTFVLRGLGLTADPQASPGGAAALLIGQLVFNLIAVGAAASFSLARYRLPASAWGLHWPPNPAPLWTLAGTFAAFGTLFAYQAIVYLLGFDVLRPESNVPTGLLDHRSIVPLTVFMIVVVAPLTEEMFFRGFLLHGLWSRVGFWPAALISGALFSVIHLSGGNPGLLIPFTIIGVLLAWLVRRTGSLWTPIAVHAIFNGVSIAVTLLQGVS
jgi:membrane protease YdiL (CAAX protease family)